MITIHKLTLSPKRSSYSLPEGAELLCAREQHNQVCVWYKCDPNAEQTDRKIVVFGTGHEIPKDLARRLKYLGTAMLEGGSLVFHVFEVLPCAT